LNNDENDPLLIRLKNELLPFFPELHGIKIYKANSSYTWNKTKIYICTNFNGVVYDDNMLIFVILHELAHVMNDQIGHTEKFQEIFQSLLDRAEKFGFYDPKKPRIENYCRN
jgi:Zn-dependent peptidase ImmA (M78 family)